MSTEKQSCSAKRLRHSSESIDSADFVAAVDGDVVERPRSKLARVEFDATEESVVTAPHADTSTAQPNLRLIATLDAVSTAAASTSGLVRGAEPLQTIAS